MELKEGCKAFVDTAPIIYFIEENPYFGNAASEIFDMMSKGRIEVVTSVLTLIEVLTKPLKTGNHEIAETYKDFFYNSKGFYVANVDNNIAELAAKIRAKHGFKTPDALQLATFEALACDVFITNDIQLKRYDETKVIVLPKM